jgi:hypothetical protein
LKRSPIPCRLIGPCTCPPALAGSTGCAPQCPLELQVYTRCFVDDLWCLEQVFRPEVPSSSLCIAYTGHISHPSAYPISGGGIRTETFPNLSKKTPTCLPQDRLVPKPIAHCLPALTFPRQEVGCPRSSYRGSVRLFPHRSCHHSVPC